jgi:tRNA 2-thiouridine synthesizing protein A
MKQHLSRKRRTTMMNTHEIDVRNMACPLPIIRVGKAMNALDPGEVLMISAHGEGTKKDLEAYCANTGNELLEHAKDGEELTLFIRKS